MDDFSEVSGLGPRRPRLSTDSPPNAQEIIARMPSPGYVRLGAGRNPMKSDVPLPPFKESDENGSASVSMPPPPVPRNRSQTREATPPLFVTPTGSPDHNDGSTGGLGGENDWQSAVTDRAPDNMNDVQDQAPQEDGEIDDASIARDPLSGSNIKANEAMARAFESTTQFKHERQEFVALDELQRLGLSAEFLQTVRNSEALGEDAVNRILRCSNVEEFQEELTSWHGELVSEIQLRQRRIEVNGARSRHVRVILEQKLQRARNDAATIRPLIDEILRPSGDAMELD